MLLRDLNPAVARGSPMSHRNARLTVRVRFEMVQQVEYGWSQAEVARQFRVSRATVAKYVRRYRAQGESGLLDRSSRPAIFDLDVPLEHPTAGTVRNIGLAAKLYGTPGRITSPAPVFAQHTREVLIDAGYTAREIAALIESGAAVAHDL